MKDDHDTDQIVLERFTTAETALGRMRLNMRVNAKKKLWRFVVNSTLRLKRGMDLFFGFIALIIFLPVFAAIALLIKLEDGGPILFNQTRVGRNGREFKMIKFRSMCVDAEARLREVLAKNQHQQGITFKVKDDPRVTRVGKWLRKLSLDELPQFVNVLRGDMSLVGPRPPVPREVVQYTLADRRRLAVTPGITCLWQIGGRSEIDFSGQVQLDVRYIESQTLWGDFVILLKTVPAVLFSRGAY